MLDREFLNSAIPDTLVLWQLASKITGIDFAYGYRSCAAWRTHDGLEWLARRVEADRIESWKIKPAWRDSSSEHYEPTGIPWSITMHGLSYKDSSCYLTAEGWCTGEPCWYVLIECGGRWYVGAETPALAVLRAIITVHALEVERLVAPSKRQDLGDTIKNIVLEFISSP